MDNINLQIHNYNCTEQQKKRLENKIEMFMRQIPYNSKVSIDFLYEKNSFTGKLKVDFNGKSVFTKDSSPLITSLLGVLCKKAQKQILKWKKNRTVEEITGIMVLPENTKKFPSEYKKVA